MSGGTLFVATTDFSLPSTADGTIGEYNATTGAPINASLVTGLTGFGFQIAVSGANLFVAGINGLAPSATNGTIGEYTTSAATVNASFLTGLKGPTGIVVSGADLFVASDIVETSNIVETFAYAGVHPLATESNGTIGEYTTGISTATDTDTIAVVSQSNQAVSLSGYYNLTGITANGARFGGGLDGHGNALSETMVGTSQTWNGVDFSIAPAGGNNVVQAAGQTITLPSASVLDSGTAGYRR